MRTIVDLPDEQIEALKQLSRASRLSRAELMRRAVAEFLAHYEVNTSEEAFGIWKKHDRDGLAYQEALRREWDL